MNNYFVIVPVFNEEKNISIFLRKLLKYSRNVVVVNDGSSDKTIDVLKRFRRIHLVNLNINRGKGAAMKEGAKLAWKLGAKGIIFMDGDNQHNPEHLTKFFKLLSQGFDIIIGVRILKVNVPIIRKLGNKLLIHGVRIIFGVNLDDLICGFRGFSKKGYKQIFWESDRYGVETEVITLIGRKKLNFEKIIVDTIYLNKYKGFSVKDGIGIMLKLPYWKIRKL